MSAATVASPPAAAAGGTDNELAGVVPSPLRTDLIMQRQLFRGNEYFVIKDPLALTYFRLQQEEGYLITLLDGRRNLTDVHTLFHARFPNKELTLKDLALFVNQMSTAGLLNINARRFVSVARTKPTVQAGWLLAWGKLLGNLIFMKFPLFDPSPWLAGLTHAIRFIWTRWFIGPCLAFVAWSAFWLIVNRDAFAQNTINFFSPENLFLVWVTIIIVKTLHEFGHATTCRHFGGEVHEMGVCLICFAPAGYVDASDAWMMRRKAHKLYTTIAGIFVEFVIAGIAAHLWLYLSPGLAKNLAFNAMIVASVNTIFFNANPLMKFDGYYVVCDLLEIPNLRAKSMMYCSYQLQRWLLGYRNLAQERVLQDEQHSRVFVLYAVLAYGYMMVIIYSLSQVFSRMLTPYGLHDFGLMLGIFVQASFLMFPIFKVLSDAFTTGRADTVREENVWMRVARWIVPLLLAGVAFAWLPSRHRVTQQAVLVGARSERAGVEVGGIVERVHVRAGEWVEAGQPLLTLTNSEIEADARMAELSFESARLRQAAVQSSGSLRGMSMGPESALAVEMAATSLERAQRKREGLVVRAPISGHVATPDIARHEGEYMPAGYSSLRVADMRRYRLMIPLTEAQAELVDIGSEVHGHARAGAAPVKGVLSVLPSQKARWEDYHPAMLAAFGGPAPTEFGAENARTAPTFGLFIAEAELVDAPHGVIEGMRVQVTVEGSKATFGQRIWRWLVGYARGRAGS